MFSRYSKNSAMTPLKEAINRQLDFNQRYAEELVADLSDEQMTIKPHDGLENHPAFTLGHLATGRALMIEDLGGKRDIPERWETLFLRNGPGDPRLPVADISVYPSRIELIDELSRQLNLLKQTILSKEISFDQKIKWRFAKDLPSMCDLTLFMCLSHESMHLGQLAAWRRAMKLPSAFARL